MFLSGGGWVLGTFLVLAVVMIVLAARAAKRRRELVQKFAAERGWQWQESDPSLVKRWQGQPFGIGQRRRAIHVLSGEHRGRQIVVFDYSYQTTSTDTDGKTKTMTHEFAVCAVRLPMALPAIEVGRETFLNRLARIVGFTDLEFEHEEFNRAFTVRAADPKFAYDLIHPRTMELLLARGTVPWRIQGDDILCWARGSYAPDEAVARLDLLCDVVDGIPSYVWTDRCGG
jgi:hypothetical protein